MMKLYEIPRGSKIYESASDGSSYITFHTLDGLFSYCETEKGHPVHLKATVELQQHPDGYKLISS